MAIITTAIVDFVIGLGGNAVYDKYFKRKDATELTLDDLKRAQQGILDEVRQGDDTNLRTLGRIEGLLQILAPMAEEISYIREQVDSISERVSSLPASQLELEIDEIRYGGYVASPSGRQVHPDDVPPDGGQGGTGHIDGDEDTADLFMDAIEFRDRREMERIRRRLYRRGFRLEKDTYALYQSYLARLRILDRAEMDVGEPSLEARRTIHEEAVDGLKVRYQDDPETLRAFEAFYAAIGVSKYRKRTDEIAGNLIAKLRKSGIADCQI